MNTLKTAVVDITTLLATGRALSCAPEATVPSIGPRLRDKLQREIRRGTLAYVDTLARARRGVVDEGLLAACRVAAERHMARTLRHQERLMHMLANQPGALTGVAAARHDLWRLAHLADCARAGVAALRNQAAWADAPRAQKSASRLPRELRKALVAYARTHLRVEGAGPGVIPESREAAWSKIGRHGLADAQRLAEVDSGGGDADAANAAVRAGVGAKLVKGLRDLALDWQTVVRP